MIVLVFIDGLCPCPVCLSYMIVGRKPQGVVEGFKTKSRKPKIRFFATSGKLHRSLFEELVAQLSHRRSCNATFSLADDLFPSRALT